MNFALGYELKDDRMSAKQQIPIRRILLKDDSAYSIRPSFLMPYMTVRTADVEGPLFLRKFGVPFWALARVFGGDPMSWYRMECGLGRFSVVGTTVRTATLPGTYWPTSIIKGSTARRSTSPRPSATGAAWERNRPRRQGATS